MVPLRFVSTCPAGHIEDFPWVAWAHTPRGRDLRDAAGCGEDGLYFYPTKRGGLSGLMVSCGKCGQKRNLLGAMSQGGLKGWKCGGNRPWLGKNASEACTASPGPDGEPVMLGVQRGASNLYFPEVASSILIPPYSSRIKQIVSNRQVMEALDSARENGRVPDSAFTAVASLHRVDLGQLKEAYFGRTEKDVDSSSDDEVAFRHAEFLALHQERRDKQDALACRPQPLGRYSSIVRDFFQTVTLVERLTETRALTGFSRIEPSTTKAAALSVGSVRWLPAFRVSGEGIFLGIDSSRIETLDRHPDTRVEQLVKRASAAPRTPLPVSPGFVLLHTIAHLLIKCMSFEAGYGASSIRERIYSAPQDGPYGMSGILLYTAAGDADGTLGGLVGLGRPGTLERMITRMLEEAMWCGSDPICLESKGQGPNSLNLAACHACALLPETSCEFQNRVLDRQTVIGFFENQHNRSA